MQNLTDNCECGSGKPADACCGPCISGAMPAMTAEALMRSRYTAYVRCDSAYLLKTWHPSTRPLQLELESGEILEWRGLEIVKSSRNKVEFIARYHADGINQVAHEVSRFVYEQEQWFYLSGKHLASGLATTARSRPGRNAQCPCGSGKKYKHCCAQKENAVQHQHPSGESENT
jgi:SEC-C motif-containing protein